MLGVGEPPRGARRFGLAGFPVVRAICAVVVILVRTSTRAQTLGRRSGWRLGPETGPSEARASRLHERRSRAVRAASWHSMPEGTGRTGNIVAMPARLALSIGVFRRTCPRQSPCPVARPDAALFAGPPLSRAGVPIPKSCGFLPWTTCLCFHWRSCPGAWSISASHQRPGTGHRQRPSPSSRSRFPISSRRRRALLRWSTMPGRWRIWSATSRGCSRPRAIRARAGRRGRWPSRSPSCGAAPQRCRPPLPIRSARSRRGGAASVVGTAWHWASRRAARASANAASAFSARSMANRARCRAARAFLASNSRRCRATANSA
jgi:hypothetical protein